MNLRLFHLRFDSLQRVWNFENGFSTSRIRKIWSIILSSSVISIKDKARGNFHIFQSPSLPINRSNESFIHEFPRGKRTAPLFPLIHGCSTVYIRNTALIGRHGRLIGNFSHAREASHADFCFVRHPPFACAAWSEKNLFLDVTGKQRGGGPFEREPKFDEPRLDENFYRH